jgi:hypothetical protein
MRAWVLALSLLPGSCGHMSFCVTGAVVEAVEVIGSWMASQPWFARPLYHLACSDWGRGLILFVVVQLCGWLVLQLCAPGARTVDRRLYG